MSQNCIKYNDSETCAGYEGNKLCAHCNKNERGFIEKPSAPDRSDKVKAAMDKILKMFESDNLEIMARAVFKKPEGSTYSKPSDNWSFINRMLMLIEETEDARGYRQWQDAGRSVKKGSKAFYIFAPKMAKVKDKETQEEMMVLTGFMTIPVFKYEDTEGEELPEAPKYNFEIPADFQGIVKELGLTVKAMAFTGGAYGFYSSTQKLIVTCTPEIKTFLHELSHAVDDKLSGFKLKGGQHNDQEVTAEFSAAVIAHMMGYKIALGNSKQYIESYSLKELMKQLNRCEKVITYIMDKTTMKGAPIMAAPLLTVGV